MSGRRRWVDPALIAALLGLAPAAQAEPRVAPGITVLPGIFCAPPEAGRALAPDTVSGWIHVPDRRIEYTLPGATTAPAQLGIGFGVTISAPGLGDAPVTYVIEHPPMPPTGQTRQTWTSALTDGAGSIFYQFDITDELLPGPWSFTARSGGIELFHMPFSIVPAAQMPGLGDLCVPSDMLSLSPSPRAAAG